MLRIQLPVVDPKAPSKRAPGSAPRYIRTLSGTEKVWHGGRKDCRHVAVVMSVNFTADFVNVWNSDRPTQLDHIKRWLWVNNACSLTSYHMFSYEFPADPLSQVTLCSFQMVQWNTWQWNCSTLMPSLLPVTTTQLGFYRVAKWGNVHPEVTGLFKRAMIGWSDDTATCLTSCHQCESVNQFCTKYGRAEML